jgi:hypothetical protein
MTVPEDELGVLLVSGKLTPELAAIAQGLASGGGDNAESRASLANILNACLRHPEWEPRVEEALAAGCPVDTVYQAADALESAGNSHDEVLNWLMGFLLVLRSQGREADEDNLMDMLDFFSGWRPGRPGR